MNLPEFFLLLLVAGACGATGQALAGSTRGGCLVSVATGFIGALLGVSLARSLSLAEPFSVTIGGASFPILWSIAGSALFVAMLSFLTRRRP